MNTKKKYEIGIERFHELMLKAESQGLTALFTDSDVCNVLFDMWPEAAVELGDGTPLTLFDTNYSDKTGPSDDNQLIDLGPMNDPLVKSISVLETDGRIVSISIDKGPGIGNATITFISSEPAGVRVDGADEGCMPSDEEAHALQLLDAVSGELVSHLERMSDEATEMLRAADGCAGMPLSLVDDIVYRWSEALLRGGPSNWRAEYEKLKNGE